MPSIIYRFIDKYYIKFNMIFKLLDSNINQIIKFTKKIKN